MTADRRRVGATGHGRRSEVTDAGSGATVIDATRPDGDDRPWT